jgi:hypothetical protein
MLRKKIQSLRKCIMLRVGFLCYKTSRMCRMGADSDPTARHKLGVCATIKKMFLDRMHALGSTNYLKAPVVRCYIRDAAVSAGSWAMAPVKHN